MRVLLTNNTLDERAGTELYVRDVALALLARGHEPIAYSRRLGEVAQELRRATVPVLDDLEQLQRPPDLIHGHHHLETMTALVRFPHTPVIYFCHGWLPDEEAPPRHPRILRYVAVDALARQRLLDDCGIPEALVETHLNFVDLERFRPRAPLPARPIRALIFSNLVNEENCLPILRQACHEAGLALDTIGRSVGQPSASPEDHLGCYDVVFAKGRAALEAAAVGASVILCDRSGLGPMVTSGELDRLRAFNFGARLLREKVTVKAVARELERYDAKDAAEVTRAMRRTVGLNTAIERLLGLYENILSEYPESNISAQEEARATSRYLRWGPLTAGDFFQSERQHLQAEEAHAKQWAYDLHEHLQKAFDERASLEGRLVEAEAGQQRLAAALAEAGNEVARRQAQVEESCQQVEQLQQQVEELQLQLDQHNQRYTQQAERHTEQLDQHNQRYTQQAEQHTEQVEQYNQQVEQYNQQVEQLTEQVEQLTRQTTDLDTELAWIKSSATWRWRERFIARGWLTATYRTVFARGAKT